MRRLTKAILTGGIALSLLSVPFSNLAEANESSNYSRNNVTQLKVGPSLLDISNMLNDKVISSLDTLTAGYGQYLKRTNIKLNLTLISTGIKLVVDTLKLTGVIPNPKAQLVMKMAATIAEINIKVNELNQKVDTMYKKIEEEYGTIERLFAAQTVRADLTAISSFFSQNSIDKNLVNVQALLNAKYLKFANPNEYTYKDFYEIDKEAFIDFGNYPGSVKISGSDIKGAIINTDMPFSTDNPDAWFNAVFGNLLDSYIEQGIAGHEDLKDVVLKRRELGFSDDSFREVFLNGCFNYFTDLLLREVASSQTETEALSAKILSGFKSFAEPFQSITVSPMKYQYEIIENSFNFQADTYYTTDSGERRSFVLDIGNMNIYSIYRYAMFAYMICSRSALMGQKELDSIISICNSATSKVLADMQSFYKVDKDGKPIDNYNYKHHCPVEKYINYIRLSKEGKIEVYYEDQGSGHWGVTLKNVDLGTLSMEPCPYTRLNSEDMTYMSIIAKENLQTTDLKQYLEDVTGEEFGDDKLVTGVVGTQPLLASDNVPMNVYSFPKCNNDLVNNSNPALGLTEHQLIMNNTGYNGKNALKDGNFQNSQKVVGETFSLTTGSIIGTDEILYGLSVYNSGKLTKNHGILSYSDPNDDYDIDTYNDNYYCGVNQGDISFYDYNMLVEYQGRSGSSKKSTVTLSVNVCSRSVSLVETPTEYGVWNPSDYAGSLYFSKNEIDNINKKVAELKERGQTAYEMEDINGRSKYWISYDLNDENNIANKAKLVDYAGSDENLTYLGTTYDTMQERYSEFKQTLGIPEYEDIGYDDTETSAALEIIKNRYNRLVATGYDVGDLVLPSSSATNIAILAKSDVQLAEELYFDENGKVQREARGTYVIKPFLSYDEGGTNHKYELVEDIAQYLSTNDNYETKLPTYKIYLSCDYLVLKHDSDLTDFYSGETKVAQKINTKDGVAYINYKVPEFGFYTITEGTNEEYPNYQRIPGQEPTCSVDGYKVAYLDVSNNRYYSSISPTPTIIGDYAAYLDWTKNEGKISATGEHSYSFEKYEFDQSSKTFTFTIKCDGCGDTITSGPQEGHEFIDQEATCDELAIGHYTCDYTFEQEGVVCSASTDPAPIPESKSDVHTELIHYPAKEASCIEEGNEEYYECSLCHKFFADAEAKQELPGVPVIAKKPHTLIHHEAISSYKACAGSIEYWECSECANFYKDEACKQKIEDRNGIYLTPAGYTYEKIDEEEADHFKSGHLAYYVCKDTGQYFTENNGIGLIEDIDLWLSEDGSGYIPKDPCTFEGDVNYIMIGDQCIASVNCTHYDCTETKKEIVNATLVVDVSATCEKNAYGHYVAHFTDPQFGSYATPPGSVEIEDTALGHKLNKASIAWKGSACTVTGICEHCSEEVSITKEGELVIDIPATCTTDAIGHYEVTFNIEGINKQVSSAFTIKNSALGHLFADGECVRCHEKDPNQAIQENNKILLNGLIVACSLGGATLLSTIALTIALMTAKKKKLKRKK